MKSSDFTHGENLDSTQTNVTRLSAAKTDRNLPIKVTLTKRETEVLRWISNGKTTWEISVILLLSEATIAFHVKNLMCKLDVHNRQQAVVVALRSGLIT